MHNVIINAALDNRQPFKIGRVDEKNVMQIKFDLNGWIKEFGRGTIALSVLRKKDNNPYPVAISIDEYGFATWNITDIETAWEGELKAQLTYYVNNKRKKSCIYKLHVSKSLATNGQAPDPYESWLEVLQELTAETASNAESAEQSVQEAQGYADDASTSAQNAENSAQSAENSADEAEHYADLAAQHAESAGYVFFDVDEQTGEAIATVTDAVDEAMTFAVDEANGDLEVTLI